MLENVAGFHRMQFQRKSMIQTQENSEKPHFVPDLGSLGPNSFFGAAKRFFFSRIWLR